MVRLKSNLGCTKCCCTACQSRVKMTDKCCICLPERICVELAMDEYENDIGCDTDGYDCDCRTAKEVFTVNCQGEYVGTVSCGGLSVDLRFVFEKNEYDECELCMYSDCLLGEGYKECIAADSYGEPGCCGPYAEWSVDASDCGNENCGTATVTTSAITDFEVRDTVGICCQECECICSCLCVTYNETNCFRIAGACFNDYGEATVTISDCYEDQELTISIQDDEYEGCSLVLSASRGTVIDPEKPLSGCPDISASWDIDLGDEIATVSIECRNCEDECQVSICCCPDPLPVELTATFVNISDCPCLPDPVTLTLTDRFEVTPGSGQLGAKWEGSAVFCSDPERGECTVDVELTCGGTAVCDRFKLTVTRTSNFCEEPDPTQLIVDEVVGPCCDGGIINFEFEGGTDDCCCLPSPDSPESAFKVVVSE